MIIIIAMLKSIPSHAIHVHVEISHTKDYHVNMFLILFDLIYTCRFLINRINF